MKWLELMSYPIPVNGWQVLGLGICSVTACISLCVLSVAHEMLVAKFNALVRALYECPDCGEVHEHEEGCHVED